MQPSGLSASPDENLWPITSGGRTPADVRSALTALGVAGLGGLLVLVCLGWQVAHLNAYRGPGCSAQESDSRDACVYALDHATEDAAVAAGMTAIMVVLVLIAALLVARRHGTARGLALVSAGFSLTWPLSVFLLGSGGLVDLTSIGIYGLALGFTAVTVIAMATAAVLIFQPDARRHLLASTSHPDRRPRAVAAAVVAATAAVGYLTVTTADAMSAMLYYEEYDFPVYAWTAVGMTSLLMTALVVMVVAGALASLAGRRWARRITVMLAMVPFVVATVIAFVSGMILRSSSPFRFPVEFVTAAVTLGGSVVAFLGLAAVLMLHTSASVTAWVEAASVGGASSGNSPP